MLNIKKGQKIIELCKLENCKIYNMMISLSNSSDLKGVVRCPQIFCERMSNWKYKCENCKNEVTFFDGYFNNGKFICYECPENKKLEIEHKTHIPSNEKFKEIEKLMIELSKNSKFMQNYLDDKSGDYIFYNPLNSSPSPLVWTKKYFEESQVQKLKDEILIFFKTYLDRFKEQDCNGCSFESTFCQHMNCTDCIRNKQSFAIIKQDRHRGGESK